MLTRFRAAVRSIASDHGVRVAKWLGDGVMFCQATAMRSWSRRCSSSAPAVERRAARAPAARRARQRAGDPLRGRRLQRPRGQPRRAARATPAGAARGARDAARRPARVGRGAAALPGRSNASRQGSLPAPAAGAPARATPVAASPSSPAQRAASRARRSPASTSTVAQRPSHGVERPAPAYARRMRDCGRDLARSASTGKGRSVGCAQPARQAQLLHGRDVARDGRARARRCSTIRGDLRALVVIGEGRAFSSGIDTSVFTTRAAPTTASARCRAATHARRPDAST